MRMSAGKWSELVSAWETSGQLARSFAERQGVSETSLRWWKGELTRRSRREPPRRSPALAKGLEVLAAEGKAKKR